MEPMTEVPSPPDVAVLVGEFKGVPALALFDWLTQPERLVEWWPERADVDLRVGGSYALLWSEHPEWTIRGEYTAVESPRHLGFTWRGDPDEGETSAGGRLDRRSGGVRPPRDLASRLCGRDRATEALRRLDPLRDAAHGRRGTRERRSRLSLMADSSPQFAVADWIAREWLPHRLGEPYFRAKVPLVSGGEHSFACVNADKSAVGTICTSPLRTGSGKTKVRADLYFLLMAKTERRFVVFTDPEMDGYFQGERRKGRIPTDVGFLLAEGVPDDLMSRLKAAQRSASDEVSPVGPQALEIL